MAQAEIEEIKNLLNGLIVLHPEIKDELSAKFLNIPPSKYRLVKKILTKAHEVQEEILEKKIKADPTFSRRLLREKIKIESAVIKEYEKLISRDDRNRIHSILEKIKSL